MTNRSSRRKLRYLRYRTHRILPYLRTYQLSHEQRSQIDMPNTRRRQRNKL